MQRDIRIACVTCRCPVGEIRNNLEAVGRWVETAAAGGAKMVCFPELNVTGYCNRSEMADLAQPIPGPVTDGLAHLAGEHRIIILAGMAEKGLGKQVYASHVVAQPDGPPGVYRKLHLAPPERGTFTPGGAIPVFNALGITFGIQLCYDAHFPELTTRMAEMGAELILLPHASPRGDAAVKHRSWMRHLPARAYDNSVFVAACNQTGANGRGLRFPGNAVVLAPSGEVHAKDLSAREGMLMADLRVEDLTQVRGHEMRYFFPNRRPELYTAPR